MFYCVCLLRTRAGIIRRLASDRRPLPVIASFPSVSRPLRAFSNGKTRKGIEGFQCRNLPRQVSALAYDPHKRRRIRKVHNRVTRAISKPAPFSTVSRYRIFSPRDPVALRHKPFASPGYESGNRIARFPHCSDSQVSRTSKTAKALSTPQVVFNNP